MTINQSSRCTCRDHSCATVSYRPTSRATRPKSSTLRRGPYFLCSAGRRRKKCDGLGLRIPNDRNRRGSCATSGGDAPEDDTRTATRKETRVHGGQVPRAPIPRSQAARHGDALPCACARRTMGNSRTAANGGQRRRRPRGSSGAFGPRGAHDRRRCIRSLDSYHK